MDSFAKIVLSALICIVALGQFVQVITRYVLQIPVMGLEETLLYSTIWLYVLGAVNASRENPTSGPTCSRSFSANRVRTHCSPSSVRC